MSLSSYFEAHEEQAFVAKALATAVAIILVKNYLSCFIGPLLLIFPVIFLIGIRMHAVATGVDPMDLLKEHITFFPMMRSEADRKSEVKPWVTYGIILTNILIFYGVEANVPEETIVNNFIFLPHHPDFFNVPFSAFSAIFLHASNSHLWGNMTFLWVVGTAVERRVGRQRFLLLYFLTGLIGGLTYIGVEYLFHGRAGHALGASGAIAGIMGIFAVRCYFKSMIFPVPILGIFSLILPINLKVRLNSLMIMALFFLSDLSGGIEQITGESASMVGHWAHLGGMISGMIIAARLKLGADAVEERHLEIGVKASQATIGYGAGERSLQIALERAPDNVEALLAMARIKTKFNNGPEGKDLYLKTIGLMLTAQSVEVVEVFREYFGKYRALPADAHLVSRLAEVLRKAGETELCIDCFEYLVKAEEAAPHVREKALYQLATLLEYTGRFEVSRGYFARFAVEFPDSILAEKAREKAGDAVYTPVRPVEKVKLAQVQLCPTCGAEMTKRPATAGAHEGKLFHVCGKYPACRTVLPVTEAAEAAEAAQSAKQRQPQPERYRLVLDGTLPLASDPEETKENLARLFRCGRERIDGLLRGEPTVIKRGLDHATAMKLKTALDGTGALGSIESDAAPAPATTGPAPQGVQQPVQRRQEPVADPVQQTQQQSPAMAAAATPPSPPQPRITCPKCGHHQEKAESCGNCGVYFAKLAALAERDFHTFRDHIPAAASAAMSESQERQWAMWCHLLSLSGFLIPLGNILGPLAIWLWKRKDSEFVDFHGKTALNYQLTVLIFVIGATVIAAFSGFTIVLVGSLFGMLGLYSLFTSINCAMKSYKGDWVEIGLSGEFIK